MNKKAELLAILARIEIEIQSLQKACEDTVPHTDEQLDEWIEDAVEVECILSARCLALTA